MREAPVPRTLPVHSSQVQEKRELAGH